MWTHVLISSYESVNHLARASTLREKCPYLEFFWSVFSHIRIEHREIRSISQYSVRSISQYSIGMRKNTEQKNSEYGHFSRSTKQEMFFLIFIKDFDKVWRNSIIFKLKQLIFSRIGNKELHWMFEFLLGSCYCNSLPGIHFGSWTILNLYQWLSVTFTKS